VISLGHSSSFINTNYRDWSAFGGIDCFSEGIVTKKGLVVPIIDGYGLLVGVLTKNQVKYLSRDGDNQQELLDGHLPIIVNSWTINEQQYQQTVYGGKTGNNEFGVLHFVKKKQNDKTNLLLSIRPFNQEGVSLIKSITFRQKDHAVMINKEFAFQLSELPEKIAVGNYFQDGDSAKKVLELAQSYDPEQELTINCPVGVANMTFLFSNKLEKVEVYFKMAKGPIQVPPTLEKIKASWKNKLALAPIIDTGNEEVNRLFYANLANLLLLVDPGTITPGPTEYHRFWCRDAAYLINALDKMGYCQYAEEALEQFIKRQTKEGFYYSHEGEYDSNGEGIWVLAEHAKFTSDLFWLEKQFESISKAADWLITTRKREKEPTYEEDRAVIKGLLPPGFSAEHLGPCDYFHWDNFWGVAGLREAKSVAYLLEKESYEKLDAEYQSYRSDLLASLSKMYDKHSYLPVGPYREGDSAMIANLCASHPTRVLDANDSILSETTDFIYQQFTHKGGFFHEVAWNCYGSYLTMHLAQAFLEQNKETKVAEIINWLTDHTSCTQGWAEGISPQTLNGGMGDSPHGWASADWIHLIRNMFAYETADKKLKLFSGFPIQLLQKGVRAEGMDTHFGKLDLQAKIVNKTFTIKIDHQLSLANYQLMTPNIISSAKADKGECKILTSKCLEVPKEATKLEIKMQ
jgi:hypothetical protein